MKKYDRLKQKIYTLLKACGGGKLGMSKNAIHNWVNARLQPDSHEWSESMVGKVITELKKEGKITSRKKLKGKPGELIYTFNK